MYTSTLLRLSFNILFIVVLFSEVVTAQKEKDSKVVLEQVIEKCKGLPRDKRITVKVARFSVSNKSAQAHASFGDELATMLTSALQETSCFRMLEMNRNLSDATSEINLLQDGFTNGSGPQAGQMIGAQLVVTGEVTDFSQGSSSTTILGVGSGSNQATVGFTLKVLNPQTAELLFSKNIIMKGKMSGGSINLPGFQKVSSNENRAVQDATQKAIIKAVEILVEEKENMEIPEPMKPKEVKKYSPQNCQMLRNGSPKVIILVTEATMAGTARDNTTTDLARREREIALREREANVGLARDVVQGLFGSKKKDTAKPEEAASRQSASSAVYKPVVIEQTATETELTRHFVEAGFRVVDPKVYGKMRQVSDSTGDLGQMAALGLKMGAQMIVTGQAVSERTNAQAGMVASRARLEIRVISTEDGSILATNTVSGGGVDVSEAIANKTALHNASANMAQYLMERLCSMNVQFSGANSSGASIQGSRTTTAVSINVTTIAASNANFAKLKSLGDALRKNNKVKEVKSTLKDGAGALTLEHTGSADDLVDFMTKLTSPKFEVTGMEDGKITIVLQ